MTYTLELDAEYIADVAEQFGIQFDATDAGNVSDVAEFVFERLDATIDECIVRAIDCVCN